MTYRKWSGPLLALLLLGGVAGAATLSYPGSGSCASTLQSCITSAASGDVIQISAATVDETLYISKSLTLVAAPGSQAPTIGGGATTQTINVDEGPGGATVDVRLIQLKLVNANVDVSFQAGSGHKFLLADSSITVDQTGFNGVKLYSSVGATFNIARNRINSSVWGISLNSSPAAGQVVGATYISNWITASNTASNYGGLYFYLSGDGDTGGAIQSNVIYNVTGCCANTAAIKIDSHQNSANNLQIIGNTIDDVNIGHGLLVPAPDATSSLYVFFYNNIVTNIAGNWVNLPPAQSGFGVFHNYNTYYNAGAAAYGGFAPGANTANQDPQYINAATRDYRISTLSPCLNAGTNSVASYTPNRDANGGPRVLGGTVDQGALERGSSLLYSYMLFSDLFDDGNLDMNNTYAKGAWMEDGKNLMGQYDRKASMFFSASVSCSQCKVDLHARTSGDEVAGTSSKIAVILWYQDKQNYVDLLIKQGADKVILRQHVNGVVARKDKASLTLDPQQVYEFSIINNGAGISVKNGTNNLIYGPLAGATTGIFGFQAKATSGYLTDFFVYY